jgi:hypothetical protein
MDSRTYGGTKYATAGRALEAAVFDFVSDGGRNDDRAALRAAAEDLLEEHLAEADAQWPQWPGQPSRQDFREALAAVRAELEDRLRPPTVDDWHVPPEQQGQIVEVAYGIDQEGDPWRRRTDRSCPTSDGVTYEQGAWGAMGEWTWEPWNGTPQGVEWGR